MSLRTCGQKPKRLFEAETGSVLGCSIRRVGKSGKGHPGSNPPITRLTPLTWIYKSVIPQVTNKFPIRPTAQEGGCTMAQLGAMWDYSKASVTNRNSPKTSYSPATPNTSPPPPFPHSLRFLRAFWGKTLVACGNKRHSPEHASPFASSACLLRWGRGLAQNVKVSTES